MPGVKMWLVELIRGKYVKWSLILYRDFTDMWWKHIKRQHTIYWENLDPEFRRQVEWKIKREQ